jgi:hypothetical protein
MALGRTDSGPRTERCGACGRETPHAVRIEILTESDDPNAPGYSREPYRVATCRECGRTTRRRMNGA